MADAVDDDGALAGNYASVLKNLATEAVPAKFADELVAEVLQISARSRQTTLHGDGPDVLAEARVRLAARGLEIEDVWSGAEASRGVVDAMPSGDVAVSLLTEYHRDSTLKWKRNHIFDIDALSVAVPYCDAVVADGDAIDKLRRSRVAERLGTPIFPSLADLVAHLS